MNILPKKRWHVRTKENIARVRRDEAKAAEEEKERQRRIELAEKEAKRDLLRKRARLKLGEKEIEDDRNLSNSREEHVNFFKDIEDGEEQLKKSNKEYEREKKEEREKYEKQIGYLTYLGQDTHEATGEVSWWNKERDKLSKDDPEVFVEKKAREDPLMKFNLYLGKKPELQQPVPSKEFDNKTKTKKEKKRDKDKRKRKKRVSSVSSSSSGAEEEEKPKLNVEELRLKRLKREKEEKLRAAALMAKIHGNPLPLKEAAPKEPVFKQRYNSQFNPHLAKQNTFF